MSKKGFLRVWMIEFPFSVDVNYQSTGKFIAFDLSEQTVAFHIISNSLSLNLIEKDRHRMSPDNYLKRDRIFPMQCKTASEVYRLGRANKAPL